MGHGRGRVEQVVEAGARPSMYGASLPVVNFLSVESVCVVYENSIFLIYLFFVCSWKQVCIKIVY